jgi:protein-L-isoaspartate(D-aspartate) O-methyltransferase
MTDFAVARVNMIESQVRPNGITDRRIISAMEDVPREVFVPRRWRDVAYMDEDIPLETEHGGFSPRALIEAMAFARLLQHAVIKPDEKVLVVGAGTGYGAAVIARIANEIVALECDGGLARLARVNLAGLKNVCLAEGQLAAGHPERMPYDVIVLEGRAEEIPGSLLAQLADGGRLVAVVGEADLAKARVYTRSAGRFAQRDVFDASVTALPGLEKKKTEFVF